MASEANFQESNISKKVPCHTVPYIPVTNNATKV